MRNGQRQFVGGTKDMRGKAALEFLEGKANTFRTKGLDQHRASHRQEGPHH